MTFRQRVEQSDERELEMCVAHKKKEEEKLWKLDDVIKAIEEETTQFLINVGSDRKVRVTSPCQLGTFDSLTGRKSIWVSPQLTFTIDLVLCLTVKRVTTKKVERLMFLWGLLTDILGLRHILKDRIGYVSKRLRSEDYCESDRS